MWWKCLLSSYFVESNSRRKIIIKKKNITQWLWSKCVGDWQTISDTCYMHNQFRMHFLSFSQMNRDSSLFEHCSQFVQIHLDFIMNFNHVVVASAVAITVTTQWHCTVTNESLGWSVFFYPFNALVFIEKKNFNEFQCKQRELVNVSNYNGKRYYLGSDSLLNSVYVSVNTWNWCT